MPVSRILILGGYGNFGKRIAESLSALENVTLVIAGRNIEKAKALCDVIQSHGAKAILEPAEINIFAEHFCNELKALRPNLVIHTGGPFQGQDYRVPEACIAVGSHYIDLADDRRFVCDITSLHNQADEKGLLLVSGASSVPGLSSTVIDSFLNQFSSIAEIDFAIAPGNKAERGEATVRGILSYTGHPFLTWSDGQWGTQYGWMSPRKLNFGNAIGARWLANVDIPDLELFPARYHGVKTVRFQAGLELAFLHFGMVFMAQLAKLRLIKNWSSFTKPILNASNLLRSFGTDDGAMQINIYGLDAGNSAKHIKWVLCAKDGIGPYIPTLSAIILAKKLIAGDIDTVGAMPCLGLFSLDEFDKEATALGITHYTEVHSG